MKATKKELLQAYKELRRAERLIRNPNVWIQRRWGYDPVTKMEWYSSDIYSGAPQVCSLGALGKVAHVSGDEARNRLSANFLHCTMPDKKALDGNSYPSVGITDCNDNHNHTEVKQWWSKSVAAAREAARIAVRDPTFPSAKEEHIDAEKDRN